MANYRDDLLDLSRTDSYLEATLNHQFTTTIADDNLVQATSPEDAESGPGFAGTATSELGNHHNGLQGPSSSNGHGANDINKSPLQTTRSTVNKPSNNNKNDKDDDTFSLGLGAAYDNFVKIPMLQAGYLSRAVFHWVTPLVRKGHEKTLDLSDIPPLGTSMTSSFIIQRFQQAWQDELDKHGREGASAFRAMYAIYKGDVWWTFAVMCVWLLFFMLTPIYFMRSLISYVSADNDDSVGFGVFLALGMALSEALRSIFAHQYWVLAATLGTNLRTMMYGVVYHKAIQLRDLSGYTVGELVNLSSNDGQRMFDSATLIFFIGTSLLMTIIVVIVTTLFVGPFAILGCGIYILFIPLQSLVAKLSGKLRRKGVQATDQRVRMMSEILNCVKLVKMYAWEEPFAERIGDVRNKERSILTTAAYIQSLLQTLVPVAPVFAGVLTFSLTAATGNDLTAEDAFTALSLFNLMRFALATVPRGVRATSEAAIGFDRLKKFLLLENRLQRFSPPADDANAIEIEHATVAWTAVQNTADNESKGKTRKRRRAISTSSEPPIPQDITVLHDINLKVGCGQLVGVAGSVGSGKSSLLSTIIGQMKVQKGDVRVQDRVAYVSQQAWIQFMSLRDNILFGEDYEEERYNEAIRVSGLLPDIEALPQGDMTEIGERGLNLSGGQKQRTALARAVYSNCDIYLFDDPLSAVDANVGRHIFDECIRGVLKGRTIVFVTHQLQYLPQCDSVVYMDKGRIAEVGSYDKLMQLDQGFAALVNARDTVEDDGVEESTSPSFLKSIDLSTTVDMVHPDRPDQQRRQRRSTIAQLVSNVVETANQRRGSMLNTSVVEPQAQETRVSKDFGKPESRLVQAEAREKGAVTSSTYIKYAQAGGGVFIAAVVLFLFILGVAIKIASDIFLSWWLEQGDGDSLDDDDPGAISDNSDVNLYSLIYGMSAVALIVAQAIRAWLYNSRVLRSSTKMHAQVFAKVMRAPMTFFDSTPTGRILNRFSKDLDDVDVQLPTVLENLLQNLFLIIFSLGVVAYVVPWFLLPMVPILYFYVRIVKYFRPTQRETKRLDNVSRSPLFSHLTATLQGLPTLHAFHKERSFMSLLCHRLDDNTKVYYSFWYTSRWFAYRLDLVTVTLSLSVAVLIVILRNDIDPAIAGLGLLYVSSLGGMFQFTTRLTAETEARFTAVERITGYIGSLPEEAETTKTSDPVDWPTHGAITFNDAVAQYREDLPPVLKGISFSVKACEKIGIAGRTGSGKSTLMLCLYRLLELESGSILIDGVDIKTLGLKTLRSNLAIIPQDPTLFVGTIRYNLDPFDKRTDAELWEALDKAHMKEAIQATPDGLAAQVVEGGDNWSVGQRQLLCLARALLRDSKILLLDEATSSADARTDQAIQDTIDNFFVGNRTLLIIAHRLETIVDADRIMVLDDGHLLEFDTPEALLSNPDSRFSELIASAAMAGQE
eukprot:m.182226 g.182226  ORF g.182226 m.182226 type:complete len:1453 (+) comp16881_c0_seq1:165-4523(+)